LFSEAEGALPNWVVALFSADAGWRPLGSTGPKDVARGVEVRVVFMATASTLKRRLTDAVTSTDVTAASARLTCIAGVYGHDDSASAFSLVKKL
jgi:hypothetical protein